MSNKYDKQIRKKARKEARTYIQFFKEMPFKKRARIAWIILWKINSAKSKIRKLKNTEKHLKVQGTR